MRDALRLAIGTLTVFPVAPPARVDRRTGGSAMLLSPVVGGLLAVVLLALLWLCRSQAPLLAATLAVSALALLTRGMHLDGLADTADGLGSGRPRDDALAVMRRGDVGPFGLVTLVLVLLLQVAALGDLLSRGAGVLPVVVALVVSRLALPVACSRGIPAARREGLGSLVAGTVSRAGLLVSVLLAAAVVAGVALLAGGLDVHLSPGPGGAELTGGSAEDLARLGAAVVVPLLVAAVVVLRCVRRLGGVTGDVLGACVELAFTASLVVLALG